MCVCVGLCRCRRRLVVVCTGFVNKRMKGMGEAITIEESEKSVVKSSYHPMRISTALSTTTYSHKPPPLTRCVYSLFFIHRPSLARELLWIRGKWYERTWWMKEPNERGERGRYGGAGICIYSNNATATNRKTSRIENNVQSQQYSFMATYAWTTANKNRKAPPNERTPGEKTQPIG